MKFQLILTRIKPVCSSEMRVLGSSTSETSTLHFKEQYRKYIIRILIEERIHLLQERSSLKVT
jgi:hypothetical protein